MGEVDGTPDVKLGREIRFRVERRDARGRGSIHLDWHAVKELEKQYMEQLRRADTSYRLLDDLHRSPTTSSGVAFSDTPR